MYLAEVVLSVPELTSTYFRETAGSSLSFLERDRWMGPGPRSCDGNRIKFDGEDKWLKDDRLCGRIKATYVKIEKRGDSACVEDRAISNSL